MRYLGLPSHNSLAVYNTCTSSISDVSLKNRLNLVANDFSSSAADYVQKAPIQQLYCISPNNNANNTVVVGSVTKQELIDLYTSHLVDGKKQARQIYEQLRNTSNGRCPFCGIGQVFTLDHYLPKTKYPIFSVLPENLIPACRDCNTGKRSAIALKAEDQCLHPYFDNGHFVHEQWLYARLNQTTPVNVIFYVQPPNSWDTVSKGRVQSHFALYKLGSRYSTEVADEITFLKDLLLSIHESCGVEGVRQELNKSAKIHAKLHINSWKTALYQALAASDWYCDKGFN